MVDAKLAPHYTLVDIPRCAAEQYPRLALGENDISSFKRTLAWDHAAGVLWLNEAGGKAARLDGSAYRVDQHDAPGHGLLVQAGVGRQGGREHGLARDEADHHLGCGLEGGPVVLVGERADVPLEVGGVLAQQLAPLLGGQLVGLGLEEGRHGGLGVDDEVLAAGQLDHHVGAHLPAVPAHAGHLLVEVAPGQQPGMLEDAPQLHLAPRATDGGRVEGAGQALRLPVERGGGGVHLRQGALQRRELVGAVALQRADLRLHPGQRVAQGRQGRSGLGVVGEGGLEVEHPLAQEVALGGGRRGPDRAELADDEG